MKVAPYSINLFFWCLASLIPAMMPKVCFCQIFTQATNYSFGKSPYAVAAADVDGDGRVDLISANYNDATLTVLTNSGLGVFGSNATYHVPTQPGFLVAADLNGDGKVDLACA